MLFIVIICSKAVFGALTVLVFGANLGDDLCVFLHLPLEAFFSNAPAVEGTDQSPQLLDVRHPPPPCQAL